MTISGSDAEFNKLMHESMRPLSPEPLEPLNELVLKHMDRLEIDRKQTLKVCHYLYCVTGVIWSARRGSVYLRLYKYQEVSK